MKAKTLIESLSLISSLYFIAKDSEFFDHLREFAEDGEGGNKELIGKIMDKAKQAKEELENKIEETASKVYKKMHIAHTDDLKNVLHRIELMERKLNLVEARLATWGQKKG